VRPGATNCSDYAQIIEKNLFVRWRLPTTLELAEDHLQDIDNPGAHPDYGAKPPVKERGHNKNNQDEPSGNFTDNHCSPIRNLSIKKYYNQTCLIAYTDAV